MPRGGARAHSGPAPDPNALRRERDGGDWVTLPESGREGEAPSWPLPVLRAKLGREREAVVWAEEWARPQAIIWEAQHLERQVADYVRQRVHAERPRSKTVTAGDRTLVRQMEYELGISLSGMAKLRWRIGSAAPERSRTEHAAPATSARERFGSLEVIDGGA
jgi:hypothetical protein